MILKTIQWLIRVALISVFTIPVCALVLILTFTFTCIFIAEWAFDSPSAIGPEEFRDAIGGLYQDVIHSLKW